MHFSPLYRAETKPLRMSLPSLRGSKHGRKGWASELEACLRSKRTILECFRRGSEPDFAQAVAFARTHAAKPDRARHLMRMICKLLPTLSEKDDPSAFLLLLALSLPLLEDSLPKDQHGVSVLPHNHRMELTETSPDSTSVSQWGELVFVPNKVCDRCMKTIFAKHFYHCSKVSSPALALTRPHSR